MDQADPGISAQNRFIRVGPGRKMKRLGGIFQLIHLSYRVQLSVAK